MRSSLRNGMIVGVVAALLLGAAGARSGIWTLTIPRSEGTFAWTFSRAAGTTAYLALTLDLLFGLFLSTGAADRWIARAHSVDLHRFLSLAALILTATHALALLGDSYIGFDALDLAVPFLAGAHHRIATSLGILALYLAIVVQVSFALRAQIGQSVWRRLHYASFGVFALATIHGIAAGTDTQQLWMRLTYFLAASSVGALTVWRISRARCSTGSPGERVAGASLIGRVMVDTHGARE